MFDVLAADIGNLVETIAFLVMVVLAGLGHLFKKKIEAGSQKKKRRTQPSAEKVKPAGRPPGPARPAQVERPKGRTARRLVLEKPRRGEAPTGRPLRQPTAAHAPAAPRPVGAERSAPQRMSPAEHAARLAEQAELVTRQLQQRARARSQDERRLSPAEHAAQLASRASQVGDPRKQHQLFKVSALEDKEPPPQTATGTFSISSFVRPDLHALRRAVLMSEIIQPPLALRPPREFP